MMRAIRDNEIAAGAMGKDVTRRHLEIFIIGSAVIGIAGAMLTTLDGQFTPTSYQPLWIEAEPVGVWLMEAGTDWLGEHHPLRLHLIENAQHMRLFFMGLVLLLVMRFSPGGILPETIPRHK